MPTLSSASFINTVGHTDRFIGVSDKKKKKILIFFSANEKKKEEVGEHSQIILIWLDALIDGWILINVNNADIQHSPCLNSL